jgi:prephenate dehydratase
MSERLIRAIKNNIKEYNTELGKNLLSKGVDNIEEFKRVYGMSQGLNKSLEIINETVEKYQKGIIEEDD